MKILILEDDLNRVAWFKKRMCSHNLLIFDNAKAAIKLLTEGKVDFIFLDHDLDGKVFVPSDNPNTGYQVALKIPETVNALTPVLIHSWNIPAAKKMLRVLEDGARFNLTLQKPFLSFDADIVYKFPPAP